MEPSELPSFISTFFSGSLARPVLSPAPTSTFVQEEEHVLTPPSPCPSAWPVQETGQVYGPSTSVSENEDPYYENRRHPSSWHTPSPVSPASGTPSVPWYFPSSPIPHNLPVYPSPTTDSHPSSDIHVALPSLARTRPSPSPNIHATSASHTHVSTTNPCSPSPCTQPSPDSQGYQLPQDCSQSPSAVWPSGGPPEFGILSHWLPTDGRPTTSSGIVRDMREIQPQVDRRHCYHPVSVGPTTPTGFEQAPVNPITSAKWTVTGPTVVQPVPLASVTPVETSGDGDCDPYNFISSPRYDAIATTPTSSRSSGPLASHPNRSRNLQTCVKGEAFTIPAMRPNETTNSPTWRDHLPIPIHRYSFGLRKMGWCEGFCSRQKRSRKTNMACATCGVKLCIECYAIYHRGEM